MRSTSDPVGPGVPFESRLWWGVLAAGLPLLIDELRSRGYDDAVLRKIGYENWIRVLDLTWKK